MSENPILYLPAQYEGGVHHYHHFLYGYYLPIILDISLSNNDPIYHTDCGESSNNVFANTPLPFKMEERIQSAWQNNMGLLLPPIAKSQYNIIKPKGFDGGNRKFNPNIYPKINRKIDAIFDIYEKQTDEYILFIDRGEPDPNFNEIASKIHVRERAGNLRRTFNNNDEIYNCLSKILPTKRAVLEEISYKEQINLFRNATYLFAQHGAALSNLIYCEKLKGMLEVCNTTIIRQASWFDFVCSLIGCKRRKILVAEEYVKVNEYQLEREMKALIS